MLGRGGVDPLPRLFQRHLPRRVAPAIFMPRKTRGRPDGAWVPPRLTIGGAREKKERRCWTCKGTRGQILWPASEPSPTRCQR
eukprot:7024045-Pyramimonas_sp.AAC.1